MHWQTFFFIKLLIKFKLIYSLARAIYRKANIYLLDDPLSAVDSHVSRHLFEQCIKDYLSGKIVVLVTHQLQYLQNVDQIVLLEHGKLSCVGTYESLKDSGHVERLMSVAEEEDNEEKKLSRNSSISSRNSKSNYKRQGSERSLVSLEEQEKGPMEQEEKRAEGSIGLYVRKSYNAEFWTNYFNYFVSRSIKLIL